MRKARSGGPSSFLGGRLDEAVPDLADALDHQGCTELAKAVGWVEEDVEDSFAVLEVEPDTFVTAGVGDQQEHGGVRVAGVQEAVGELENGEPVDRDAGDFDVSGHGGRGAAAALRPEGAGIPLHGGAAGRLRTETTAASDVAGSCSLTDLGVR